MTSAAVESVDFRTQKMPSREGHGKAARAWEAALVGRGEQETRGIVESAARRLAVDVVVKRLGFGIAWQLFGGFEGLRELGMSEAGIYRGVKAFRQSFGQHPDDYRFPGVAIDVEAFVQALAEDRVVFPGIVKDAVQGR